MPAVYLYSFYPQCPKQVQVLRCNYYRVPSTHPQAYGPQKPIVT